MPAPGGGGKLGWGRGSSESPREEEYAQEGEVWVSGAGFVLREHESPGGLREASGGRRTEVWEGSGMGYRLFEEERRRR